MSGTDLMVVLLVAALMAGALVYLRRSRRAGKRCPGCPDSGGCCCAGGGAVCTCHEDGEIEK